MRILVDQDGVLADFEQRFFDAWTGSYPDLPCIPKDQRRHFHLLKDFEALGLAQEAERIYTQAGFIAQLPPVDGAIAGFNRLVELGHEVFICTSPLHQFEHCVLEKFLWVEKHLGREWTKRIIMTRDKTLIKADVLIDDNPDIQGTEVASWTQWLYDAPYNRHLDHPRRMSWKNIQDTLLPYLDAQN